MCERRGEKRVVVGKRQGNGIVGDLKSWQQQSSHQFWTSQRGDPWSPMHLGWFEGESSFGEFGYMSGELKGNGTKGSGRGIAQGGLRFCGLLIYKM